jgi:fumarylacetoacetase
MTTLNETHDVKRRSWVESANQPGSDFPIQNLPLCVFRRPGEAARGGVAIGDQIVDLSAAVTAGLFSGRAEDAARAASGAALNPLMALGNGHASALRQRLSDLLRSDGPDRARVEPLAGKLLTPVAQVQLEVPAEIGAFSDFLCSYDHTMRMSRTGELPPAFAYLPIAYNSRATTIISGGGFKRPNGQFKDKDGTVRFGPEPSVDFELELGAFVGPGNEMGEPMALDRAAEQLFGYCLLNDWSARGIQMWESTPLGPFLGKSFATTVAPFIVTEEALRPFRVAARQRGAGEPAPLPYLASPTNEAEGGIDIVLEAFILTPKMQTTGTAPSRVTSTNFRHMYWTLAQMLTHHASNGCKFVPGDLLGSGTCSGPTDDSRACLAELSQRGTAALTLAGGESRTYLLDGDEVIFRGRCERAGFVGIGFGECRGTVLPAPAWPG